MYACVASFLPQVEAVSLQKEKEKDAAIARLQSQLSFSSDDLRKDYDRMSAELGAERNARSSAESAVKELKAQLDAITVSNDDILRNTDEDLKKLMTEFEALKNRPRRAAASSTPSNPAAATSIGKPAPAAAPKPSSGSSGPAMGFGTKKPQPGGKLTAGKVGADTSLPGVSINGNSASKPTTKAP